MQKAVAVICLAILLIGCENMYEDDGIARIRNQRDVDAYNATVSSEGEKLTCSREFVIGTNFREFICMTVAQRERMRQDALDTVEILR
ncbi:MAG: hypothetical protein IIB77_14080 [Proteobacteria bacterium]|nr:hypothetical protein [Pseudomonadota bacterium]